MPGKHYDNMGPQKRGPYMMNPGENSKPSKFEKVNFRDSDLKKAEGFPNLYPQNFNAARVAAVKAGKDSFKVGGKEFKVTSKAGAEMHHAGMYNPEMKPMNAVDGKSHADLKAAGGKAFDIHMRDHNKGVFPNEYKPLGFASDAQRRAAFASGYKAKSKK